MDHDGYCERQLRSRTRYVSIQLRYQNVVAPSLLHSPMSLLSVPMLVAASSVDWAVSACGFAEFVGLLFVVVVGRRGGELAEMTRVLWNV